MEISIDSCFGRECNEYLIVALADKYYMANSIYRHLGGKEFKATLLCPKEV